MSKNNYKSVQLIEDELFDYIQKSANPKKDSKQAALLAIDQMYLAYSVHTAMGKPELVQQDAGTMLLSLLYFSRLNSWHINDLIENYSNLFSSSEKPKPVYYWLHELHVAYQYTNNAVENTTENRQRMQTSIFGVWHSMAFVLNDQFGLYILKIINDTWEKSCGSNAKSVDVP